MCREEMEIDHHHQYVSVADHKTLIYPIRFTLHIHKSIHDVVKNFFSICITSRLCVRIRSLQYDDSQNMLSLCQWSLPYPGFFFSWLFPSQTDVFGGLTPLTALNKLANQSKNQVEFHLPHFPLQEILSILPQWMITRKKSLVTIKPTRLPSIRQIKRLCIFHANWTCQFTMYLSCKLDMPIYHGSSIRKAWRTPENRLSSTKAQLLG